MLYLKFDILTAILIAIIHIKFIRSLLDESQLLNKLPSVPTFCDVAAELGKKCETYYVTTEDGYILEISRIPGDPSKPVLMMHGIIDSSNTFIARKKTSIAYKFAENGYDIFAGNNRGNRYSRNHTTLNPDKDEKFWNFTWDDMGRFDLPALIDFVLDKTGQKKLRAIGHSEGTTQFFVMGATRPEYNDKVHVLAALAPVAYLQHTKGILPLLIPFAPALGVMLELAQYEEVMGFKSVVHSILRVISSIEGMGYNVCMNAIMFPLVGFDPEQIGPGFSPYLYDYFPAGTSRKNLIHYAQIALSGIFRQYDYGLVKNLGVYKSLTPTAYDLTKVTMNVGLYLGFNDFVSTVTDVEKLRLQLPNAVEYKLIDNPLWNHMDHIIGENLDKYLYPYISDLFKKENFSTN